MIVERKLKNPQAFFKDKDIKPEFPENPPPPQPQAGPPQGGPQKPPAGAQVQDTQGSGGGTIGTGTAPQPGEQGFSANTGQGPMQ